MKTFALALAAALTVAALTGCSAAGNSADDASKTSIKTMDYRGENIDCIKHGISESQTRACDFTKFYAQHPDLLDDHNEDSEDDVEWVEYDGEAIACLRANAVKSIVRSCDFDRFYADHPDLLGK